jgi:hypothetical protein
VRHRIWRTGLAALVVAALLAGVALSANALTGTVTKQSDGQGLGGAAVTVAGPNQPPITQATGGGGGFSIQTDGSAPYSVGVAAAGHAGAAVSGISGGAVPPFVLRPAIFTPLPVFGGATMHMAADARSGIFYALMNQAPEVYRTVDYGGSWQSVTMSYDAPGTGLTQAGGQAAIATSGVTGEVAVGTPGFGVHYSTDYGLTWRTVDASGINWSVWTAPAGVPHRRLFWAHAGGDNVLMLAQLADGGWRVARADMSAASPALVEVAGDPFGAGAQIDVARSGNGAFVGRVTPGGGLSFAPLRATGDIAFGPDEATGLPTPPLLLRLGGVQEAAAPPGGVLVVGGNSPYSAQMLTKAAGASSFAGASSSQTTALADECKANQAWGARTGSVAPTSGGDTGAGTANECWLQKSGTGALTISHFAGAAADMVYDAAWGGANHVAFLPNPNGPSKFARLNDQGVPEQFGVQDASPGPGQDSGGHSVVGIVSPVVDDTAYGPRGTQDVAVAIGNGQLTLASRDGGATMTQILGDAYGSTSAQWWPSAGGADWLAFGGGQLSERLLTAVRNWDGSTRVSDGGPNVIGSGGQDLSPGSPPPQGYGINTLAGVAGTDTLFIGLGFGFDPNTTGDNAIYRGSLVDEQPPRLAEAFRIDTGGVPLYFPQAMAYCPPASANEAMRDVLFVATGDGGGTAPPVGSLLRITAASSGSPAVKEVTSVPHGPQKSIFDVRADCAAGVIFTSGMPGLFKSTDGGQTFSQVAVPLPRPFPITAVGLNPSNPNDVTIGTFDGTTMHSSNGGGIWTLVNDPTYQRQVIINDIEVPPGGAGASRARAAAAASSLALVGTGGGAFHADFAVSSGIIGLSASSGGGVLGAQVTNVSSDAAPSVAVDPAGKGAIAVFSRVDGLASVAQSGSSWQLPQTIPGTLPGDREPALARDTAGHLALAFRRPAGAAPGIYLATRAVNGAWTAPERVSTSGGDMLPSIALTGPIPAHMHVAFLRPRGRSAGVHYAAKRRNVWRSTRVPGTGAADARLASGGAALASDSSGGLHVAFARLKGKRGIYYAKRGRRAFGKPKRLTRGTRDWQPALVVGQDGLRQLVFKRGAKRGSGLYALTGGRKWRLVRLPGTGRADREPDLTINGNVVRLAFTRIADPGAGVYLDQKQGRGGWLKGPAPVTTGLLDRSPVIRADNAGKMTILFDRG